MKASGALALLCVTFFCLRMNGGAAAPSPRSQHGYLGMDRNDFPGDEAMAELHNQFSFTGYWLTPPPEEKTNSWAGKRRVLEAQGYGFALLARGRTQEQVRNAAIAQQEGTADAREAARSAKAEGFAAGAIIFLDIEEGGRLPETYHAYLTAWSEQLASAGYKPGVYCSGIPVKEEPGVSITTAEDIRNHAATREMAIWAFNDACPPSPGCAFPKNPPAPSESGTSYALVWQFVRSPRDKQTARLCRGYAKDGNCYAPGDTAHAWFLDVNSAVSPDPSGGAK